MAIRLYPMTTDPAKLEKLCGVPAGTAARLAALEAKYPPRESFSDYRDWCASHDRMLDEVYEDKHLLTYHRFNLFGWGRATHRALDVLLGRPWDDDWAGHCDDEVRCARALMLQAECLSPVADAVCAAGLTYQEFARLCGGLYWG